MSRVFAAAALAAFFVAAAADPSPEIDRDVVVRSAAVCTAEGAFGQRFGDKGPGLIHPGPMLGSEWHPYRSLSLNNTSKSHTLFLVETHGYFGSASETVTDHTRALAAEFHKALLAEIDATRSFAAREDKDGTVTYYSVPGGKSGYKLEVSLDGPSIYITCIDVAGQQRALKEFFGDEGSVSRPEPPAISLPPRPAAAFCADPSKIDFDALNAKVAEMGSYTANVSSYFTQLTDWKGQQFVTKKVWTKKQKQAFALAMLKDPVIAKEFRQNVARLNPYIADLMAYGDALVAKQPAKACALAARLLNTLHDMQDSNELQWKRAIELYDGEAKRLKIVIE